MLKKFVTHKVLMFLIITAFCFETVNQNKALGALKTSVNNSILKVHDAEINVAQVKNNNYPEQRCCEINSESGALLNPEAPVCNQPAVTDQCMYSIEMTDSYGDGWNGSILGFRQQGVIIGTFGEGFVNGFNYGPVYLPLNQNLSTDIVVVTLGQYTSEVGFVLKDPFGIVIYTRTPGINFSSLTLFTTFTTNCTPPECMMPVMADPSNITTTTATLNWLAPVNPPVNGYQYEVRIAGSGGSGSLGLIIAGNTNAGVTSASVNCLNPSTTYYIYVRSCCAGSEYSDWVGPKQFNTLCGISSTLLEGFENLFPPVCWSLYNAGNGYNWQRSSNSYIGNYSLEYSYDSLHAANAWLFTSAVGLVAGRTYVFQFFQKVGDNMYPEKLKVTVGNSASVAAQTQVIWNNAGGSNLTNTSWIERKVEYVCTASGTCYFAFNCYSDANMFKLYIDNVSIMEKPQVDLSLSDFYQTTTSLTPDGDNQTDNYIISQTKNTINESLYNNNIQGTYENISPEHNVFPDSPESSGMFPTIPVNIQAIISNLGVQPSNFSINWNVGGLSQTPYTGSAIVAGGSLTANLTYVPLLRGTFISTGNVVATGDGNASNNTKDIRIRVYPDVFTRTLYDRGDNIVDAWLGYNNASIRLKSGVRFTASKDIKLAGVDFICRTEAITSGSFTIQVRSAGSTTNAPGNVLYTKSYNTADYLPSGLNGDYITFPFDDSAPVIQSGNEYWITIKSPLGVLNPGAAQNTGFTAGRSFYEANGDSTIWYPLVLGTERAWLMRSIEVIPPVYNTLNVKVYLEGLWNGSALNKAQDADANGNTWDKFPGSIADTVSVTLAGSSAPYTNIYTVRNVSLNTDGTLSVNIPGSYSGSYYIVIRHRNSVETWSSIPVSFNTGTIMYDFTTSVSQAYGNNQKPLGSSWGVYTGDITQNGYVELNDVNAVYNIVRSSGFGYQVCDVTGDGFIEVDDVNKTYTNQRSSIGKIIPGSY